MRAVKWHFVNTLSLMQEYALLMILFIITALYMANTHPDVYHGILEFPLFTNPWIGHSVEGVKVVTVLFFVTEYLMQFFFGFAFAEVWEERVTTDGRLNSARKAALPFFATVGGALVPAAIFLVLVKIFGMALGWQAALMVTPTDIALSTVLIRAIYTKEHATYSFLMAIAILDDLAGMFMLAVFGSHGHINPEWLALSGIAMITGFLMRGFGVKKWYWYLLVGQLSWVGFHEAGLHAALGLIPMVMVMPHENNTGGWFTRKERDEFHDTLNETKHALKWAVEFIVIAFVFVSVGIPINSFGTLTGMVAGGLIIGKVIGIVSFVKLGEMAGLHVSKELNLPALVNVGMAAGIGFTVSLIFINTFLPEGSVMDQSKMGALLSLPLGVIGVVVFSWIMKEGRFAKKKSPQTYVGV